MQIAVILAGMEVENQAERYQGFADEIALHEECSIAAVLEADYNLLTVKEQLPELLEEHPEINAIFCAEGYSSSIVGTVVESLGFSAGEIRIVGFDKTEEILAQVESGRYYSTIAQRSDCMGELAVKALADYQNGILPEQDIIYTEITSIRRENLAQAVRYESEGVTWHLFNGTIRTTQLTGN